MLPNSDQGGNVLAIPEVEPTDHGLKCPFCQCPRAGSSALRYHITHQHAERAAGGVRLGRTWLIRPSHLRDDGLSIGDTPIIGCVCRTCRIPFAIPMHFLGMADSDRPLIHCPVGHEQDEVWSIEISADALMSAMRERLSGLQVRAEQAEAMLREARAAIASKPAAQGSSQGVRFTDDQLSRLTPRIRQMAELWEMGLSDTDIAARMGVLVSAVSEYRKRLLASLGLVKSCVLVPAAVGRAAE